MLHKNINHEVNVTMLTYNMLTNMLQNEWNIIGSFMSPLSKQDIPGRFLRLNSTKNRIQKLVISRNGYKDMYKPVHKHLYSGFEIYPGRPDDFEGYGAFIVERRPEGTFATTVVPLVFIGWVGVLGTLIPRDSGEKLRFVDFYHFHVGVSSNGKCQTPKKLDERFFLVFPLTKSSWT